MRRVGLRQWLPALLQLQSSSTVQIRRPITERPACRVFLVPPSQPTWSCLGTDLGTNAGQDGTGCVECGAEALAAFRNRKRKRGLAGWDAASRGMEGRTRSPSAM
jgi:hypothetical protein